MAASNLPKTLLKVDDLLGRISGLLPDDVALRDSDTFVWSPKDRTVSYSRLRLRTEAGQWALIHETSHALLDHKNYENDFELLQLEVAAWKHAKELAKTLGVNIDRNFIEDCLDTYRDWLHQRSTCPTCGSGGLQQDTRMYRCHNCLTTWHVSQSRFCRPYRKKQTTIKTSSDPMDQTMFQ